MQQLLAQLYGYLPTVVLGGLAIFPLTALEIGLLALPVTAAAALAFAVQGVQFNLVEQGGVLWFMMMMLGVAIFSGMSQCHYMATLVHRAMHDVLTGAYTRQSGEEALDLFFRLSSMSGKALSVAFIDLDRFKPINDQYGHDAGDHALRDMAERLQRSLRRSDLLVRWGGEEFVVVLPDTAPEHVHQMFQRLRDSTLGLRPDGSPLTASVGVASTSESDIASAPALIAAADRRMYAAKKHGRNTIVLADGQPMPFLPNA
jgi:diguanylate cyclase (GGDEF)-like protein